jgi:hypothetical protein
LSSIPCSCRAPVFLCLKHGGSTVACQTVVLQSRVQIRRLPVHSWLPISWWVATWDGTWMQAYLCEEQQRRKIRIMNGQIHIKKKYFFFYVIGHLFILGIFSFSSSNCAFEVCNS